MARSRSDADHANANRAFARPDRWDRRQGPRLLDCTALGVVSFFERLIRARRRAIREQAHDLPERPWDSE